MGKDMRGSSDCLKVLSQYLLERLRKTIKTSVLIHSLCQDLIWAFFWMWSRSATLCTLMLNVIKC